MKRFNTYFKLLLAGVVFLMSSPVMAAIDGSGHDFEALSWNTKGEICSVCHTPHNGNANTNGPLWDRSTTAVTNFTLYSSNTNTLNATLGQPAGLSLLCLSCHDGTIALDNTGGSATKMTGTKLLGTDLSNDHPISFTYDAALVTADGSFGLNSPPAGYLFNNKVECASCHDVHNGASQSYMLRETNAGSALCLVCHDK